MPDSTKAASTVLAPGYASTWTRRSQPTRRTSAITRETSPGVFLRWFSVAFVACFGLIWIYVATMPMAFLDRDYPLWVAKRTMLDECKLGTVAVFGDSRTLAATVPAMMPVTVSNFAMSGTSPIETYFNVQRALRCPALPKLVLIAHGALKFVSDSDYWVFDARMGFLSYAEMRAIDRDATKMHDTDIASFRPNDHVPLALRELLFTLRFPAFYFDSLVNSFVGLRLRHNLDAMHDALLSSGHALFGTAAGFSGIAAEGFGPAYRTSPLIDMYFSRTLMQLARHNVPVYFLSMPVNRATYLRIQPELKESFATYLRSKEQEFPNLHVIGPTISCWPDRFFGDAWHFNARGADEYSRELGEWLRNLLADGSPSTLPNHCVSSAFSMNERAPVVALKSAN